MILGALELLVSFCTRPEKKARVAGTTPFNRPCEPYAVVALTPVQAACMDMQGQTQVSDKFYTALKPYHKNDSRKVR